MIGTTIEFFDFYIYGTAASNVFPALFFPATIRNSDTGVACHLRDCVFRTSRRLRTVGHFGDRVGRKTTLVAALLTMGLSTVAIGVLPTCESIGLAAPALLALCRFGQGLGLGGEWGGAVSWPSKTLRRPTRIAACFRSLVHRLDSSCLPRCFSHSPPRWETISSSYGMASSVPRERGSRAGRALRPFDDYRNAGVRRGCSSTRTRQGADARRLAACPRNGDQWHASVARYFRRVLSDDGVHAVMGNERPWVYTRAVSSNPAGRRRDVRGDDSGVGDAGGARTPPCAAGRNGGNWPVRARDGAAVRDGHHGRGAHARHRPRPDGTHLRTARRCSQSCFQHQFAIRAAP